MRTEKEMMELILSTAQEDERIRLVTLEGSRANVNVPKDEFQDYDITYFVTDMGSFLGSDDWLDRFGERIIMQKPEDMELFPPHEPGFSYLMLFTDGNRIDLTFLPLIELDDYLQRDKLVKVLLDKDGIIAREVIPTDEDYHVKKPSPGQYHDCCNEFWWVTPYVVKGLCRKEILFAIAHMDILRSELLRMMAWKVGIETGFSRSVGKNCKYLERYVSAELWDRLLSTYRTDSYESAWQSLFLCLQLFRDVSKEVGERLGYVYPDYDERVTAYTEAVYQKYGKD